MPGRTLRPAAEVGLAAVTLTAVLGMSRLFDGKEWFAPLMANAVAAHLVAVGARQRGLSLAATTPFMAVGAWLVTTWTLYGPTTAFGMPAGDTFAAMRADLSEAWSLYQDVVAPAPVETGFVLASAIAIWCIAYMADWAAFRLWVPFEATLPAGTLFLFTALLGAEGGGGWAVGIFAGACLSFFLLHRMSRQDRLSHWVGDGARRGHRWLLAAGVALGAGAVVAGSVVGPMLPGADAAGVIDPRGLGPAEGSRITISPLVDIRSRLVQQSDVVAFEVRSPEPAYWRLTSLDRFDGRIWSSSGTYGTARGSLPRAQETDLPVSVLDQTFTIGGLTAIWLPSAYEPRSVESDGFDVLYDEFSATLIVDREIETSNGLTYGVTSSSPRLTRADLAGLRDEPPDDVRERFLALPDDFSPRVAQLAREITQQAIAPYDQALALQQFLRGFTYDLEVAAGHSDAVLEQFLFETKRGYCEQFAGAFAAMARSVGLPARVAVGFTQGIQDPADPTRFVVRGEHAHAWPEVYLSGAGWVSFEPTPGRGQPFAESYTDVPVAQASAGAPGTATTAPPTTAADPGATIPDASTNPRPGDEELNTGAGQGQTRDDSGRSLLSRAIDGPVRAAARILGVGVALYVVVIPLGLVMRRALRRRRATTGPARISLAWTEAAEVAALIGYREVSSATYAERAEHLSGLLPEGDAPAHARQIARRIELAYYSEAGADDLDAGLAEESSGAIVSAVLAVAPLTARIRRWLDPRPWMRVALGGLRQGSNITTTVRGDLRDEHELVGSGERG